MTPLAWVPKKPLITLGFSNPLLVWESKKSVSPVTIKTGPIGSHKSLAIHVPKKLRYRLLKNPNYAVEANSKIHKYKNLLLKVDGLS